MKFVLVEGEQRMRRLANSKKLKLNHAINVSRGTPEKSKLMQLVPKAIMQRSDSAHRNFFKGRGASADKGGSPEYKASYREKLKKRILRTNEGLEVVLERGSAALSRQILSKKIGSVGAFKSLKRLNYKQIEGGERATKSLLHNPNSPHHGKLRVAQVTGAIVKKVKDRFDKGFLHKKAKVNEASRSKLERAAKGSRIDFMKHMDIQTQIHNKKKDGNRRFKKNKQIYKINPSTKIFNGGLTDPKKDKAIFRDPQSLRDKYIRQGKLKKPK